MPAHLLKFLSIFLFFSCGAFFLLEDIQGEVLRRFSCNIDFSGKKLRDSKEDESKEKKNNGNSRIKSTHGGWM